MRIDTSSGFVELVDYMGSDAAVVAAARVSYMGDTKGEEKDKQLINFLMTHGHMSPFEMVVFTFKIKCPLFVRSQIVRHRTASMNELSRRYTSNDLEFYVPDEWHPQEKGAVLDDEAQANAGRTLTFATQMALNAYKLLIAQGVALEQARMILPQNLLTSFFWKMDLRNLFHFLELRNSDAAQAETRECAQAIERIIVDYVPWSYDAWIGSREISNG